ncbi:hypothetical protein ACIRD8_30715 [Streptomyces sp. NPDC102451]|uniref:hypothetical protein n=1 Tax=Streptomyces sp. NPDC102451 TaxID=3366177 RepID=UPI0037F1DB24
MSVLVSASATGAWAWSGLRLEPRPAMSDNGAHVGLPESQRRAEAAALEQVWLSRQWVPDGRAFELRYTNGPHGITGTLLCRAGGTDGASASAAALTLRDALSDSPRHVRAAPIEDADELHGVLVPSAHPPSGLAEVRKRLLWSYLGRRDTDFPLGVAFEPLIPESVSWEPVWEALVRESVATTVSICLEPYAPPDELRSYLTYLAQEYGRLSQPGRPSPVFAQYIPPDPFAVRAAPLYQEALGTLTGRAYRLRISLATPGAVPHHLAGLIAATVSAPYATGAGRPVAQAVAAHEAPYAWGNITGLQHCWLETTYGQDVPQPLGSWERVLADLVDVPQASAVFRFPYEIPGRPPLFAASRRAGPAATPTSGDAPRVPGSRDPHTPTF